MVAFLTCTSAVGTHESPPNPVSFLATNAEFQQEEPEEKGDEEGKEGKDGEEKIKEPKYDDAECDPPCIPTHGICHDSQCYCESPYYGSSCQLEGEDDGASGVPVVPAIGGFCAMTVFGIILGISFFKCCVAIMPATQYQKQEEQIEV